DPASAPRQRRDEQREKDARVLQPEPHDVLLAVTPTELPPEELPRAHSRLPRRPNHLRQSDQRRHSRERYPRTQHRPQLRPSGRAPRRVLARFPSHQQHRRALHRPTARRLASAFNLALNFLPTYTPALDHHATVLNNRPRGLLVTSLFCLLPFALCLL